MHEVDAIVKEYGEFEKSKEKNISLEWECGCCKNLVKQFKLTSIARIEAL